MGRQLLILLAAFLVGTGIAALLGAINAGVAFSIGTLCFMIALVTVIMTEAD